MRYNYTWTTHTFQCRFCRRPTWVANERLEPLLKAIRAIGTEPDVAVTLRTIDTCISCIAGREVEGEHDVDVAAVPV